MDEHRKIGVLVGQVGTPDAPTTASVRRYLRAFLSDPRVIDLHPLIWKPILHGVVLRTRPKRSAGQYKAIWTPEGSPLLVHSRAIVRGLQERLGPEYVVELGTAYGAPRIAKAVERLEQSCIRELIIVPLFPEFSTATTASIFDEVYAAVSGRSADGELRRKGMPPLHFISSYFDDHRYLHALTTHIRTSIKVLPYIPDRYLISFHGLPERYVRDGDPYREQCESVSGYVAKEMGWESDQYTLTFQSRFGREKWLSPYTETTIRSLPAQGVERLCVIPLSFTTDCLETLHELGIAGRNAFVEAGGDSTYYSVLPCLNDSSPWLDALSEMVRERGVRAPN